MGFVPPETPDRPDWMDDETWRRFLRHESETIMRIEERQAETMGGVLGWNLLLLLIVVIGVLCSK